MPMFSPFLLQAGHNLNAPLCEILRKILSQFLFSASLRQSVSAGRTVHPDLGQEISISIPIENQLGFIRRLKVLCGIATHHHARVAISGLKPQYFGIDVVDAPDVVRSGWKRL